MWSRERMTRRSVLALGAALVGGGGLAGSAGRAEGADPLPGGGTQAAVKGRLKQSACRWCYNKIRSKSSRVRGPRLGSRGSTSSARTIGRRSRSSASPDMTPGAGRSRTGSTARRTRQLEREVKENIAARGGRRLPERDLLLGQRRGVATTRAGELRAGLKRVRRLAEQKA